MRSLFIRASESKEKIVIFYMDANNKITQRFVKVIKLNDDYMLAYCYYRKKLRTFKIEHILSAGPVRKGVGA